MTLINCRPPRVGIGKRLAAVALLLALDLAATAASAQTISLGSAGAFFREGGNAGITVQIDLRVATETVITFRVALTGGPAEEDTAALLSARGNTRLGAFVGGVTTGTDTISSRSFGGNIQFRFHDVDHLPHGTTRGFTITLLSGMAGDRVINLGSPISYSTTISYGASGRRFSVALAPASASVNVDRDSTAPGLQVDEDFGADADQTVTFRVTLATLSENGQELLDNNRARVNWAATVTGDGASGAAELTGTRTGTLEFLRDDDNPGADNYETPQDVEVRVVHDTINEAAQTLVFTLTCSGGDCGGGGRGTGIGTGTATVGILPSDPLTVSVISADQMRAEGNTADGNTASDRDARRMRFTVTAVGATASDADFVLVPLTIGGTAADATDYPADTTAFPTGGDYYTLRPGSGGARAARIDLRASRDMSSRADAFVNLDVVTQLDDINEADGTVVITLAAPGASGYATEGGGPAGVIALTSTVAAQSATATIEDDDGLSARIARRAGQSGAVIEGGSAGFTVSLVLDRDDTMAGVSAADICVAYDIAIASQQNPSGMANTAENADVGTVRDCDGNTVVPDAAGAASGGLLIPAGQSGGNINIMARHDDLDEGATDEELSVTITGATHRTALAGADLGVDSGANQVAVNIENLNEDIEAPAFLQQGDQPGWSGGQQVLWVRINEDFKVLPYPGGGDGATVSSATASIAGPNALPAGDFTVMENAGSPSSATIAVSGVTPFPGVRALRLELQRAIAADAANITVAYERSAGGANAIYDLAVENDLARNNMRNATTATRTGPLTPSATDDFDTDGIPDAVEAGIRGAAGNPFVDVTDAQQPAFDIHSDRDEAMNPVAYSGIREHGVRAHLGVSSVANTTRTAAQTVTAYYRSDTFGYDGTYSCTGQFPANYDAPLADGGCAAVDWGNIAAGVDHTIAWLARSADGVWAVDTNTPSNLPEQTIRRVPELNMAAQSLFTTGTSVVVVRAFFDADPATGLTLALSRMADESGETTMFTGSGSGRTLAATDTSPVSALWEITGLTAGSASRLYRPNTPTAGFTPNYPAATDHSLGLARQTRVLNTGGAPVPPVLGRAVVLLNNTPVLALVEGNADSYTLDIPVENHADIGAITAAAAAMATHNGTLDIGNVAFVAASGDDGDRYRYTFTMRGSLPAATMTAVIRATITGGFGGAATAVLRYPIVASGAPLATARADSDNDGIPDMFDDYDARAHLPVAVSDDAGCRATGCAGAGAWHHIRPALPTHDLRLGEATAERLARAGATDADNYAEYSASSVPADGGLAAVYDFEIGGVDYAAVSADARTGGAAGVIIPLPESLAGSGASLVKVRSDGTQAPFSVAGENDYGFAPLQEDGACPDDTMEAGSPYREGATLRRAKRGDDACLVVYIVDGGANDEDGMANGIIKDPLGVRIGNAAGIAGIGGGSSSSGAFGPFTLAVLTALAALLLLAASPLRRRRPV